MKKVTLFLSVLLVIVTLNSFSQDQNKQAKKQIKPALVVIDIQNAYLKYIPDRDKEVGLYYINELINLFRKNGFPVIRVYHFDKEFGPKQDSEDFQFPSTINIKPDDPKVIKTYGDGFNKTDLDKVIKEKGSNTLFMCGLSAVGCVLATWIGAQNHDYQAFLVKDAIMSHNSEFTNNIENIFDATGFEVVKLIVENSEK